MGEFDGKVAFVTGAARGQGRSHAVRLAREGAAIVAIDVCAPVSDYNSYAPATAEDLDETVRLVEAEGGRILARRADVRDSAQLAQVVADGVAEFGRLDVVIANAGICNWSRFWEMPDDQWETLIDVNLTGVWKTLKASVPAMIEAGNGGSIVVVSSVAGIKPIPGQANYAAAKSGLVGLTQAAAKELGEYRIRVNSVHPYGVDTPMGTDQGSLKMLEAHPQFAASLGTILTESPLATVDDISDAVLWIASDKAHTVTATQLTVDMGNTKV
ncbi:mycofactocin-coupled SDR family oxidoreductase [Rhodococcus sp. HNM0569]|uniref:mycofactocin-coupled SDR family oxidoreductase n=1 Tax=Rhodococcus sp. HNM0569 TaxID=2716340 RepID=UPI00146AE647|nr:mycofactocin-coupled SDR family oxidoreductase [Rhodococcus sp. HNM0569]NLU81683.1 mycofactocin-coupled SDR family oxidoreductase [Rhodococcus sp. HNM0569]